jgi:hypothetical protein
MASTFAKIAISVLAAIVFFAIESPTMYSITGKIPGVVDSNGTPTWFGVGLHAGVYGLVTYLLMLVPFGTAQRQSIQ